MMCAMLQAWNGLKLRSGRYLSIGDSVGDPPITDLSRARERACAADVPLRSLAAAGKQHARK